MFISLSLTLKDSLCSFSISSLQSLRFPAAELTISRMAEAMDSDSGGCPVPAVDSQENPESCSLLPSPKDSTHSSSPIVAAPSTASGEDDRPDSNHSLESVSEELVADHTQEMLVLEPCRGKKLPRANSASGYSAASEDINGRVEILLEAKKKKLLAELEGGGIFKGKTFMVDASNGFEDSDGPSLKARVIDDTVLIEPVSVFRNVQNGGNGKRNGNQGAADGKKKRVRRKGKDSAKGRLNHVLERSGVEGSYSVNGKYSREELEAMRFMNIVEQRSIWRSVYNGLEAAVAKEYEGLSSSRGQKNMQQRSCDSSKHHPPRFVGQAAAAAGATPGLLGEGLPSETVGDELENMVEVDREEHLGLVPSIAGGEVPEECDEEYDDSDDDYASIQKPAFHIEGEPDFDSGPPEDGLEYLRRVRWEAARIPKVKVAKLDDQHKVKKEQSVYMPQIPDIPKCPDHLLPSKAWEDAFLADFSQLRLLLARDEEPDDLIISHNPQSVTIAHEKDDEEAQFHLPTANILLEHANHLCAETIDPNGPQEVSHLENSVDHASSSSRAITDECNTLHAASPTATTRATNESSTSSYPTLSAILAMDSVARVSTLKKRISSAEGPTTTSLSKNECLWLFALCAAVDTPLLADTSAAIRGLLRKCAILRAAKTEIDDDVVMLNILATICGRYFGQAEC